MPNNTIALNATADINAYVNLAKNAGPGVINPETFYSKQLLDTIRYDASQYVYYRVADETPIQEKADKLMLRRWAPLQAHTVPLTEGVPPKSDKGSVEKYELTANQYGRYMEFTDKVDFNVVDPIIAHYTKEYSLVAMETLDLLAREALFTVAQKFYAGGVANALDFTAENAIPTMNDLRLIVLSLKQALVKPRINGRYMVIGSPEFYFDMISDPTVEKFMQYNNTTKTMYEDGKLVPMFEMEFYETMLVPTSNVITVDGEDKHLFMEIGADVATTKPTVRAEADCLGDKHGVGGYVLDSRTNQEASYIPAAGMIDHIIPADIEATHAPFKLQHILVLGKDALTRTSLTGEGQTRMYVKQKGSAGVLDPIDQRQSIGFKINSVGFGSTRLEAIVDYVCVPSQVNNI